MVIDTDSNEYQVEQLLNEVNIYNKKIFLIYLYHKPIFNLFQYSRIRLDINEIKNNIEIMRNIAYPKTRSFRNSVCEYKQ